MPAIWNLHHEHCRIFQGHTFIGCVFSVGPRGFAPIGPSKFARGKGCKSHSLDWSEEKMKKAPCRFSKTRVGIHIQSSRWFQMSDLGNSRFTKRTSTKFGKVSSLTTRLYKRDVWQNWGGSLQEKLCMFTGVTQPSQWLFVLFEIVPSLASWKGGSNGHAAEAAEAAEPTNLSSQRIRKETLPECSPSVRVERRKEREFGRYHHLNLVDRSIWAKFMKQCQQCWEP